MTKIKNWQKVDDDRWFNEKAKGQQSRFVWIGFREIVLDSGKIQPQYIVWESDSIHKMPLRYFTNKKDAKEFAMGYMRRNTYE